jgi:hypothetical protein
MRNMPDSLSEADMRMRMKGAIWGASLALFLGTTAVAKSPSFKEETSCGDYGTSVHFENTPIDAAKAAKKDGRLVMVLHISGHFEDPGLT